MDRKEAKTQLYMDQIGVAQLINLIFVNLIAIVLSNFQYKNRLQDFITRQQIHEKTEELLLTQQQMEQAKQILAESEERFRIMYEDSYDAIMLLDETGFLDCNKRTLELFGFVNKEAFCRTGQWVLPRKNKGY